MSEVRSARDRLDRIFTILRRAFRFWVPAALVVCLGGAAALGVALLRPRVYRSETLILYREGIRASDLGGLEVGDPARKLGMKLKEMVLSRSRLQKIIDEFKLYPALVEDRGYVDAVDEMRRHISFRAKDGDTFGLSFEGNNPKLVQEVTARLAEALLDENSRSRAEQAEVTREFLDAERRRAETDLKERETALAKFLAKHPEFARETANVAGAGPGTGTAIRAAQKGPKTSDPTLLALEREATRLQQRLGMPTKKRSKEDNVDPRLLADKQQAEADLASAQKDLADKLAQFTEQHPDVHGARARVKSAEARLKRATEAVVAGAAQAPRDEDEGTIDRTALEAELRKVNEEIAAHRRRLSSGQSDGGSGAAWIVALETEWQRLNREVAESRERNQQLQDRSFKATMAESAVASGRNAQMIVIDPAYRPTHPARPGRAVIVAGGLALSIACAVLLALGLALVDDRIYDRIDLEKLGLTPLAVVPRAERDRRKGRRG
jgi:uncharacterized protein involved in exopolysaccharide biosynthesis